MHLYSVDSSALIEAWSSWYTKELHGDFWTGLVQLGNEGRLLVSAEVLAELSNNGARTDDPIYRWCKSKESMICVPSDITVQSEVARLTNKYHGFGGSGIPGAKDYADPFVVAIAKLRNAVVITHEKRKRNKQHVRIPDVCIDEGIKWSPVYGIIKREKWTFSRK